LVVLVLERSLELVVALAATLEAGAAYVPLDPEAPPERLAYQIADARPVAILTCGDLAGRCRPAGDEPPILLLDADGDESLAAFSDAPLPERALPENLAYVIYTSGSTGRPKGAMNTREGLDNLVAWHLRAYAVTAADRSTLLAAPSFDASTWEIWPALAAGARLLIADDATRLAPEPVRDWLAAESATLAFLPTPLAEATLALPSPRGTSLRVLLTGGDRLRAAPRPAPPFLVVNHYGPTEATVVATASPVTATGASPPAIGRPLPNVRAYVLDAEVEPAPIGVPGELFLAGVQVGRGYLARPDLTADRVVPDPFSLVPGARLYRTGDLARLADDGAIHFLGRLDHQVKLRGFRIELGEIEATLAEHPAVAEAAVGTRGSAGREARLVAYIALRAETTVPELRAALAARLPSYMVPATFVRLDGLPRSAHGKIDRNALPIPEDGEREGFAPAATPVEDLLAGIWSDLLGVAAIGREDDFFALGGHSLLAAQVIGRTRAAFAVELPVRLVFDRPTLAAFAAEIETALAARRGPAAPPIVPMSRTSPLPLSSGQRRLWLMDQLAPGSADFVIAATFDLGPSADPGVLRRALGEILRRHEALRTTFAEVDGRPVQRIATARDRPARPRPHRGPRRAAAGSRAREDRRSRRRAFRSRPRSSLPGRPVARRGSDLAAPGDSSHRRRRLVDRGLPRRASGSRRSVHRRTPVAAPGAAGPICRLRDLAAARRGGVRRTADRLARTARRRTGDPSSGHRP